MNEVEKTENAFFNADVFSSLQKNDDSQQWRERTKRMSEALAKSKAPILMLNGILGLC
jgi:hypothetical protein